jgi:hypothetical protein
MTPTRPLAVLAAALALAMPATALASGAGDQQYQDPFGNTTPSKPKPKATTPSTPAPSTPVASTPSQPLASSTPASSTSSSTSSTAGSTASGQLPRTGLDLRVVGGIGVLLLGAGLLVRRLA